MFLNRCAWLFAFHTDPVPMAVLTKGIMLPKKWSRGDLKSSDSSAIVFIFASKQVLWFCICRSASLSLLCFWRALTFSFAALVCRMGRASRKVVGSGSSESQCICVYRGISVSQWLKQILAAANCINSLESGLLVYTLRSYLWLCIASNFI